MKPLPSRQVGGGEVKKIVTSPLILSVRLIHMMRFGFTNIAKSDLFLLWRPVIIRCAAAILALGAMTTLGVFADAADWEKVERAAGLAAPPPRTEPPTPTPQLNKQQPNTISKAAPNSSALPCIPSSQAREAASPEKPVYLNQASIKELMLLPGIGQKRAESIIALRDKLGGRFRTIEQLLLVKGIGRKSLTKFKSILELETPALEIAHETNTVNEPAASR